MSIWFVDLNEFLMGLGQIWTALCRWCALRSQLDARCLRSLDDHGLGSPSLALVLWNDQWLDSWRRKAVDLVCALEIQDLIYPISRAVDQRFRIAEDQRAECGLKRKNFGLESLFVQELDAQAEHTRPLKCLEEVVNARGLQLPAWDAGSNGLQQAVQVAQIVRVLWGHIRRTLGRPNGSWAGPTRWASTAEAETTSCYWIEVISYLVKCLM